MDFFVHVVVVLNFTNIIVYLTNFVVITMHRQMRSVYDRMPYSYWNQRGPVQIRKMHAVKYLLLC